MDYEKHYNNLIHSRQIQQEHRKHQKKSGEYFETHHILPKCLGGNNDPINLILLTGREHFIAHKLLWKIHGGILFYAVWRMSLPTTTSGVGTVVTSRQFEYLRKQQRVNNRRYGKDHWNYGKKHSKEAKKKMSLAKLGKPSPRKGVTLSTNTKEKLRKANIGKTLSENHKKKISEGMKKSNHPFHNLSHPFFHARVKTNKHLQNKWKKADYVYDVWIKNNKPGPVKLSRLTNITYLQRMIKWFKTHGDPKTNKYWIEFTKGGKHVQEKGPIVWD